MKSIIEPQYAGVHHDYGLLGGSTYDEVLRKVVYSETRHSQRRVDHSNRKESEGAQEGESPVVVTECQVQTRRHGYGNEAGKDKESRGGEE